jgi:hypothetical protein
LSGEQYLHGTAAALCQREDGLLSEIQPWLTLDSKPEDHRQARLEAWSCFSAGGRFFVSRMGLNGEHDRRAAYFSHARSWPEASARQASDPGACLGCSAMFDPPDISQRGASDAALGRLAQLPAEAWKPALEQEPETAIRFLGHLLQVMSEASSPPLIIGAPLSDFVQGSPLFALLAYARAALPAHLKPACAIRMHTRQPENFALRLNARLLVLPEDSVADAVRAQPQATLLDRQGACKLGQALAAHCQNYASELTKYALAMPEGLLPFSAFIGREAVVNAWAGLDPVPLIRSLYALAAALADPNPHAPAQVFEHVMRTEPKPGFPWSIMLQDEDWRRFPLEKLGELALAPPARLRDDGERNLQTAVLQALARLGANLDACLAARPLAGPCDDAGKQLEIERLLQLLGQAPLLFSENALHQHIIPILGEWALIHPSELGTPGQDLQADIVEILKQSNYRIDPVLDKGLQGLDPIQNNLDRLKLLRILDFWKPQGLISAKAMREQAASLLRKLVLAPASMLGADSLHLQHEADHALSELGLNLDDALEAWLQNLDPINNSNDRSKLGRILGFWNKKVISEAAMRNSVASPLQTFVLESYSQDETHQLIQKNAEKALQTLGLSLDEALEKWPQHTDSNRQNRLKRLLELLNNDAFTLFKDRSKLAAITQSIVLPEWSETHYSLHKLLELEINAQALDKRPARDLAQLAEETSYYQILLEASKDKRIKSDWAAVLIDSYNTEAQLNTVLRLTAEMLKSRENLEIWGHGLALRALDRWRKWVHDA